MVIYVCYRCEVMLCLGMAACSEVLCFFGDGLCLVLCGVMVQLR